MKKILFLAIVLCSAVSVAQGKFEQGMGKAMQAWKEGKPDDAVALLERIAIAEPTQWLPDYYVAFITTLASFESRDQEQNARRFVRAQNALDAALMKTGENDELHVLQALLYTARIVADPMTNGMTYSPKVMEHYNKALAINPENPRAVFGKAEFEINSARFFGKDISGMCGEVRRSITLFEKEKPSGFMPSWGRDRAAEVLKNCK